MSPAYTSAGSLGNLAKLPKVAIVHMEHAPETFWRASGNVEVGVPVVPTSEAHGKTFYDVGGKVAAISGSASVAASRGRLGIAMNETGLMTELDLASETVGPVEVVNRDIVSGGWVRVLKKGTFHTTLLAPVATATGFLAQYKAGDMVTYNPAAARATSVPGTGAYVKTTDRDAAVGYLVEAHKVTTEGANDVGYGSITLF